MAKINLLPWREEQRNERQRDFFILLGVSAGSAIAIVFLALTFLSGELDNQNDINRYIKTQISDMDKQIKEISELEKTRESMLARKQVIEELQSKRSLTVQLLNELVLTTPIGITLVNVQQTGMDVTLSGTAQSNARVSQFLTKLSKSKLLIDPELTIIEADDKRTQSVEPYNFRIRVRLKLASDQSDEGFDDDSNGGQS